MKYITLEEAITYFDERTPNQYTREEKIRWISELDEQIYEEIIKPRLPLCRNTYTIGLGATDVKVFLTMFDYNALLGTDGQQFSQSQIDTFVSFTATGADTGKTFGRYDFNGYADDTDGETVLIVPSMYKDIYRYWLEKNVDINNREIGAANNAMALFEAAYDDYYAYYNRNHRITERKRIIL